VSHHRAATALLLVIIAACAAAFLRAEQLKLRHSPVARPHVRNDFSPGCTDPGCTSVATLRFTLRSAQTLTLAIVDRSGTVVRRLADRRFAKGTVNATWDGSTDGGATAPDGHYRLQVTLGDGRKLTIPDPIVVDTRPAGITLGPVHHGTKTLAIPYTRSQGNVHALLIVLRQGSVVLTKRVIPRVAHLSYDAVKPGHYTIEIVAVDRAGNRTPNPPSVSVTIP
jgi:hypothetical protein